MSYILDALKKIEHEKNKRARSDGRISISGDLFQERKRPATRAGIWKIMLLIAVASLLTFTGTWFLLQGNGKKSTADISPAAQPPPVPVYTPSLTAVTPAPAQPQPAPPLVAVPPSATSAPGGVVPKRAETAVDDGPAPRSARTPQKETKVSPPYTIQPAQTVQAPTDIKLSGIAWQDSRAARRAVINGFLLKEGAVVAGAKITDIQADRVRFISSNGSFEIKLDSVLPAEVKQ